MIAVAALAILPSCQYSIVKPDSGPKPAPTTIPVTMPEASCSPSDAGMVSLPEPGPYASDDAWCVLAGQNLVKLGCCDKYGRPIGGKNVDGEDYAVQCRSIEVEQHIPLNSKCTAKATTCEEALLCTRTK